MSPHVINLTEDDLAWNGRGLLSAGQRRLLAGQRRLWLGVAGTAGLLAGASAAGLWLAISRGGAARWLLLAAALGGAALLLLGWLAWRRAAVLGAALARGEVAAVEGPARYAIARGVGVLRWTRYAVLIADARFPVSQAVMFSFASHASYRVFHAPGSRLLLGAAPLAGHDPEDSRSAAGPPPDPAPPAPVESAAPAAVADPGAAHEPLTPREAQILGLLADGLSNQEIADRLHLSLNTIKMYASQIYAKLGVRRRTEAVAYARRHGLIDPGGRR